MMNRLKLQWFLLVIFFMIGLLLLYSLKMKRFPDYQRMFKALPSELSLKHLSVSLWRDLNVTSESSAENVEEREWKTVLYWTKWFGYPWSGRFGSDNSTELQKQGCPIWRCNFTSNRSLYDAADAVIFMALGFGPHIFPSYRPTPKQRWVWVEAEAPIEPQGQNSLNGLKAHNTSHLVNWTMTYHSKADVMGAYGYFIPINGSRPINANLMSSHEATLERYLADYKRGITLEEVMGPSWKDFVKRPNTLSWMSSHCHTNSKREDYIGELSKYVKIDKYGGCGPLKCNKKIPRSYCWETMLERKYFFYLSMENNICDEYITEKLYLPLQHNVVPIVWGGSDYSQFLPLGSYINARLYHPRELAMLLDRLVKDPVAYGRYHVWRGYFAAIAMGSMCELCYRLHTDSDDKVYDDIPKWRILNNKCIRSPKNMFNNPADPTAWKKLIFSNFAR